MSEPDPRTEYEATRRDWNGFIVAEPFENVDWPEVPLSLCLIASAMLVSVEKYLTVMCWIGTLPPQ